LRVLCKNLGKSDLLTVEMANGFLPSTRFHLTVGRKHKVYGLLFERAVLSEIRGAMRRSRGDVARQGALGHAAIGPDMARERGQRLGSWRTK
jgi:hypothetical protein